MGLGLETLGAKSASPNIRRVLLLSAMLGILLIAASLYAVYTGRVPWWLWLAILAMAIPLGIGLLAKFAARIYLANLRRFS